jgi:hypothetical protein
MTSRRVAAAGARWFLARSGAGASASGGGGGQGVGVGGGVQAMGGGAGVRWGGAAAAAPHRCGAAAAGALCVWTRNASTRVPVQRIRHEEEKTESRGHKVARLQKAKINHNVRMAKEKAREEIENEARTAQGGGGG